MSYQIQKFNINNVTAYLYGSETYYGNGQYINDRSMKDAASVKLLNQQLAEIQSNLLMIYNYKNINDYIIYSQYDCIYPGLLSTETGEPVFYSSNYYQYTHSDYIDISNYQYIYYYNIFPRQENSGCGICLYDAEKNYIVDARTYFEFSNIYGISDLIDIKTYVPDACYVRFCNFNGYAHLRNNSYLSYIILSNKYDISLQKDKIDDLGDVIRTIDITSFIKSKTILTGQGVFKEMTGYRTTNIIPIPKGTEYILFTDLYDLTRRYEFAGICLYDENQHLLSSHGLNNTVKYGIYNYKIIDEKAKYIAFSTYDNKKPIIKFCKYYLQFELQKSQELLNSLYIEKNLKQFGECGSVGSPIGKFNGNTNKIIVTQKNAKSTIDGYITNISLGCYSNNNENKIKMIIGKLDQNNICIPRIEFDVIFKKQISSVDVRDKHLKIYEGEHLFAYACYYQDDNDEDNNNVVGFQSCETSIWGINYPEESKMIYGNIDSPLQELPVNGGGCIYLIFNVVQIDSIFALKDDSTNSTQMNYLNDLLSKSQYIYDDNNNAYKIKVVDGQCVPVSIHFKQALLLGNSLTSHGLRTEIGYYGEEYAMAATSNDTCWGTLFKRVLQQKNPDAVTIRYNVANWETQMQNYMSLDSFDALLSDYIDSKTDLIIFKAGENVSGDNLSIMKESLTLFIQYLKQNFQNATILMATQFWTHNQKDSIIMQVANETNTQFIYSTGGEHLELLGDYTFGSDGKQYPIIHSGVANHVSDNGFYTWTNTLAKYFKYEPLNEHYNISISTSKEYKIKSNTGIKNGLITVQVKSDTQPVCTILDSISETIEYTVHDLSKVSFQSSPAFDADYAITFIMPGSDVTVTIE